MGETDRLIVAISDQALAIADTDAHVAKTLEQSQIGGSGEMLVHLALNDLLSEVNRLSGLDLAPHPAAQSDEDTKPDVDRTVEAWTLDFKRGAIDHPGTLIGGQPTWLADPTWPLTRVGTPMSFWGQFEIPWKPGALAYLFIDVTDGSLAMTGLRSLPGSTPLMAMFHL